MYQFMLFNRCTLCVIVLLALADVAWTNVMWLLWQEIRENQRRRDCELRNANSSNTSVLSTSDPSAGLIAMQLNGRDNRNALFGGALTNLIVIVGFAAFAFAVKQILAGMVEE